MASARTSLGSKERRQSLGAGSPSRFLMLASLALALCLFLILSPSHLVTLSPCHGEEGEGVPSFRRVLLPPHRLTEELKRVRDGVLIRLPLAEFDTLADNARRGSARANPPRLLEARYHAVLKDEALIGEGQWKLIHKGPAPGLLKLDPFNLALRQARFENGDALIAAFDGKVPALLVETAGEQTLSLDWSARAEAGPEGLRFQLETPRCPIAVLELDVPAGRGVTVDNAFLSEPHEAETADLRRWKITYSDRELLRFRILPPDRPTESTEQTAPLVRQKTTQKLRPEGLDATFELTLEGLSRGVRQLVCECDSQLRLRDVSGPGVEGCSFQAGKAGKPSRLTIRLREAVRSGTWQIACLAPLKRVPAAGASPSLAWRSPGLHLVNGVPRGESLILHLDPEVRVESWEPGSFKLLSSELDRTTGMQVLTLRGGGLGPSRRPQARLQAYGVEFRAPQLAWWRCDAAGMSLTLQIAWEVSRGQLFQLPVLLPANWSVEKVEMSPAGLLRDWRVHVAEGKATLLVDLNGPLPLDSPAGTTRARTPVLTVRLRPSWSGPFVGKNLDFPLAEPLGARFREGALALDCDEQLFYLNVTTKAERAEPEREGPWGKQLPEYYYRYNGEKLVGQLQVRSRPPRLRAKCNSEVFVVSGLAIVETQIQLEAEAGNPNTIELLLSASDAKRWHWNNESSRDDDATGNRIRRAERLDGGKRSAALHLLAASNPLQASVLLAAQPRGERWRLTLTRPLRARETLRLRTRRELQPHDNRWDVPLPIILGADRMEGDVRLYLTAGDLLHLDTLGLREAVSVSDKGATPWRTFRYGQNEVGLTLSGQALASGRSTAAIPRARLLTSVGAGCELRHHFSFQVANWTKRELPLILPPGSQPLAVAVDGHWLPHVLPAANDDATSASAEDTIELALPVPGRDAASSADNVHRFDVTYARTVPTGLLWQSLDAPAPRLPVAPLALRRVWRLPSRLTPLFAGRYQSQPSASGDAVLPVLPHRFADLFQLPGPWDRFDPLRDDPRAGARAALDRTVQEFCGRQTKPKMTLREVVSEISFRHLKDRYPLIIDATALRQAGVTPETTLTVKPSSSEEAVPPWTACGLVAVPARSAILLTALSEGGAVHEPLDDAIEEAVAAARERGQDASGRFRSALNWVSVDGPSTTQPGATGLLDFEDDGGDGSDWEPLAGEAAETLLVVRREAVTAAGLVLALLMGLFFWLLRRGPVRRRLTLLLLALASLGVAVTWLPVSLRDLAWWPLLAGCAGAVLWYLRSLARPRPNSGSVNRKSKRLAAGAATAGLIALALFGWHGRAAAPAPATVYLVPGPTDAPRNMTALVPADLLERLRTRARSAPLAAAGPSAVLLDAVYEGQLVQGQAEFNAVFSAHCSSDEARLTIPLSGVQPTGEVWLDGARADLMALPAPRTGYSLKLRGQGRHKIELRFRVPVAGTNADRNVLFTVPPLLRSRLSWRVPPAALHTRVLVKHGAQWTVRDGGGERVEADLGALPRPVHLHWHQPGQPARVTYQAAYLWNLGLEPNKLESNKLESNKLTAWVKYRVDQGAVSSLQIDLPTELEVSSATAQRLLPATPPPWLTRFQLRDWYVRTAGGKRTLHLTFPYPIGGDFLVTLDLLPRAPLSSEAMLLLPTPRDAAAGGPHYLAYRTQPGLHASRPTFLYLSRILEKEFAPDWPTVKRLETPLPGAAYQIDPKHSPREVRLSLHLEARPPQLEADVDVTVRVAAQQAELQIVADLHAPNKDLVAVLWDLRSPCTIAAVSGEDVRSWTQTDRHLLVWLNRTTTATRIHLSGWLPLDHPHGPPQLHLFGPRLQQAGKQHTQLRLHTVGDVGLGALRTNNLRPAKQPDLKNSFETSNSFYDLHAEVQSAANATARVLTLAEVADRELRFTTTVDYQIQRGELRQVQLRLGNWEREKVEVQAERVALWSGPRRAGGEHSWRLSLQPGVTGRYQVTLRYSMPLEEAAVGVPMPEVLVAGVEKPEYVVAVAGGELTGQPRGALRPLEQPGKPLKSSWPGAAARLERTGGKVWRLTGSEWQLLLLPHARALEPAPVRLYLLEQSAAVVDGRRWLHEARFWLHHEAHTDLHVDFPAAVRVLAAAIDGEEATPLQPAPSRLWLPLPGRPGVRCIRLRWTYDSPEPLDRPNLTPPTVADAVEGPRLWTVLVPAGWEVSSTTSGTRLGNGATREAELALHRAEAQLRIIEDLSKQRQDNTVSAALAAAQRRFASSCRRVRHALDTGARPDAPGLEGRGIAASLEKLLKSDIRSPKSERDDRVSDIGDRFLDLEGSGTPLSWYARPKGEPPRLQLASRASRQTRHALAASGQWLGALVVVWILSFLPFLLVRLRPFWPEQLALAAALGWQMVGWTSIVLALLLLAVCGRSFLLIRALRHLFQKRRHPASTMTPGSDQRALG